MTAIKKDPKVIQKNISKKRMCLIYSRFTIEVPSRDLHRVPEAKKIRPDPTQTRNRVGFGFGFENQFFSGSGRFSGLNFFVRVGFGFKNQLFFGKIFTRST